MKRNRENSGKTVGKGMRRREFLQAGARLGLMTSALALPNISLGQSTPRNILMIPIDDLNDWVSPLGGYSLVKTPNIARLAKLGCVYKNGQSNVPACSPSRTATLFGIQPYVNGVYTNREHWELNPFLNNYASLPKHFRNHGYFTVGTGKVFHNSEKIAATDPSAWDEYHFCGPTDKCPVAEDATGHPVVNGISVELSQYAKQKPGVDEFDFGPYYQLHQVPDVVGSTWMAQNVLAITHAKPFFAACWLTKPHLPLFIPQQFFTPYPLSSVFYPPGVLDPTHHSKATNADTKDLGVIGKRINTFLSDHTRLIQTGEWKPVVRAYLAAISFADYCVGLLLDALLDGPNKANTIIVLWSDHGFQLGEKLAWRKYTLWERALRVPLIFAGPGIQVASRSMPASLIDLYPTLSDLAFSAVPGYLQGKSLKKNLTSGTNTHTHTIATWREASSLANSGPHFSIRTATHRYIKYQSGEKELYDHRVDRYEFKNRLFGGGTADDKQVAAALDARVPPGPYAPPRGVVTGAAVLAALEE
jgi:arylsulfatase A-like enzyme